ncbi:uncharacterized protein LOC122624510 isoform X4 [Drosophila teissieri]|uniref:uncharacterized protein LOC122624510 isoform X4 n=1 Tax=Drosophila teissieri TaxID=7243 RepID=UPI001CBA2AA9|nr:uncharacterized protein LOC122624510 isoform X4 [Drosophila teissieri]
MLRHGQLAHGIPSGTLQGHQYSRRWTRMATFGEARQSSLGQQSSQDALRKMSPCKPHPLAVDSGLASSPIATWPRVYMRSGHKVTPTNALYSLQKVPAGIWEYGHIPGTAGKGGLS